MRSFRKSAVVAACIAAAMATVLAVAAAGTSTSVPLNPGQSVVVTCSGTKLSSTTNSSTSRTLSCAGRSSPTTTTTTRPVPPTTTSTSPPTTTTTSTPPTTTTTAPSGSWWVPGTAPIEWQWELDHPLSTSSATDMGTDDTAYSKAVPPATDPTVYDIDGFDNPASTVSALHALGDRVVCYIEVGSAGNYYTAAEEGQSTTYYAQLSSAGDLGTKQSGWPEYYLNINSSSTLSIVESMISECHSKGFDAIETDNDEIWQYKTGFTISEANVESYMLTLINFAHARGLGVFVKNPDDVGNTSFSNALEPYADAVITEQCNQYATCADLGNFLGHKAIFNAEYSPTTAASFCSADDTAGINGTVFDTDLDGATRVPCR